MKNNQTNTKPKYGTIQEGFFLREYVGEGTTPDGQKFELAISCGNAAPLVLVKSRAFILSWNDICKLAEDAGLFQNQTEGGSNGK